MNRNLILGALLTSVFLLSALVSFVWTPFSHTAMDIPNKLQGVGGAHLLGTDHFGRDILSMIMVGARTSIAVALVAVGIGMGLGDRDPDHGDLRGQRDQRDHRHRHFQHSRLCAHHPRRRAQPVGA